MPFHVSEKKEAKNFKKTQFMDLPAGQHVVRVLNSDYVEYDQHWIGGGILCLGEDECPQCQHNRKILAQVNGDFNAAKKVNGFNWRQTRGAVNVLDRTNTKICPKCGKENKSVNSMFSAVCPECGTILTEVPIQPLNQVKVFSRAKSVFDAITNLELTTLDANKEPLGINNFDLNLHVVGNTTLPLPGDGRDKVEVPDDALFDLDNVVLRLSADEMEKRMRGVSVRDIFAARNIMMDEPEVAESKLTVEEVEKKIDELFA